MVSIAGVAVRVIYLKGTMIKLLIHSFIHSDSRVCDAAVSVKGVCRVSGVVSVKG